MNPDQESGQPNRKLFRRTLSILSRPSAPIILDSDSEEVQDAPPKVDFSKCEISIGKVNIGKLF